MDELILLLLALLLVMLFVLQIRKLYKQDMSLLKKIIFFFSPVKIIAFTVLFYAFYKANMNPAGYSLFVALYIIPTFFLLLIADYFASRITNRKNFYLVQFFIVLLLIVFAGSIFS